MSSEAKKTKMNPYTLIYWPGLPGRGEFIRLAFEYAAKEYEQDLDVKMIMKYKSTETDYPGPQHFAPPMLKLPDGNILSQTPAILSYIAPELGLAGSTDLERAWINQLTLTVLDLCDEIHNTHHPISVELYYEDQKEEAMKRAKNFRDNRGPKFLGSLEAALNRNKDGNGFLVGNSISVADLCLFQVVDGLQFAFPKYAEDLQKSGKYTKIFALYDKVKATPTIAEYLKSDRRHQYSPHGIFRHYPELDKSE